MTVIDIAKKYIGQTEKPGNMGFNDHDFEHKMIAIGFQKTHAWCCYFAELCFKEAFPQKLDELNRLFSASTIITFRNFKAAGYPISLTPVLGALVIWQTYKNGESQGTGHAGVCIAAVGAKDFHTVEGNTNDKGGREGYITAEKARHVDTTAVNGLRLLGFIKIG